MKKATKIILISSITTIILLCGCTNTYPTNKNEHLKKGMLLTGAGGYQLFDIDDSVKNDVTINFDKIRRFPRKSDGAVYEIAKLNNGEMAIPVSRSNTVHFAKDGVFTEEMLVVKNGPGDATRAFTDNEKNLLYVQDFQRGGGEYTLFHVFDQTTHEEVAVIESKGSLNSVHSVSISDKYLFMLITNGRDAGFNDVDERYILRIDRDTFQKKELAIKEFKYNKTEDFKKCWLSGDIQCVNNKLYISMYELPPTKGEDSVIIPPIPRSKFVVLDENGKFIKEIKTPLGAFILELHKDKIWMLQTMDRERNTENNKVYVFDIKTEKIISEYSGFKEVTDILFFNGCAIISSSFGNELVVVNTNNLKEIKRIPFKEKMSVSSLDLFVP